MPAVKKAARKPLPLATDPAQILDVVDLPERTVEVSEWGFAVKVRGFSLKTQQAIQAESVVDDKFDSDRHTRLLLIHGIVEPKFTPDQADALAEKSVSALTRVVDALNECNGEGGGALANAEREFLAE